MTRRPLTALFCAVALVLAIVQPIRGDVALEAAVAAATGITRVESAELHDRAHARAVQIVTDFNHCCLVWGEGEIIGWNRGYADPIANVIEGWTNSPSHWAVMTNRDYTQIGCAEYVADEPTNPGVDETHYFVCLFRAPQLQDPSPAPAPAPAGSTPAPAPVLTLPDAAMAPPS